MAMIKCSICGASPHIIIVCADCGVAFCEDCSRQHGGHPPPDDYDERDRWTTTTPTRIQGTDGGSALEDYGRDMEERSGS